MIDPELCESSIGATIFIWWLLPSTAATFIDGRMEESRANAASCYRANTRAV